MQVFYSYSKTGNFLEVFSRNPTFWFPHQRQFFGVNNSLAFYVTVKRCALIRCFAFLTQLVDDPIFIPISTLEQRNGKPAEFDTVAKGMMDGETGSLRIENAIRSIPKGDFQDGVMLVTLPSTYYYTSIKDSEYVFAFNLADSDKNYRRPASPPRGMKIPVNYYANILSYNSPEVRQVRNMY